MQNMFTFVCIDNAIGRHFLIHKMLQGVNFFMKFAACCFIPFLDMLVEVKFVCNGPQHLECGSFKPIITISSLFSKSFQNSLQPDLRLAWYENLEMIMNCNSVWD